MKNTVVIGLGNLLMSDEGIGVRVVQELLHAGQVPEEVELLDLGPGGLQVLHALAGKDRAIFVDCAFMDCEPGTLLKFNPDQARTQKVRTRQSLHEGDLFETLQLAQSLGRLPEEVVIFGIQPECIELGDQLSDVLAAQLQAYVDSVVVELGRNPDSNDSPAPETPAIQATGPGQQGLPDDA